MVINRLKVGDEAVHKAERFYEILEFKRSCQFVGRSFHPDRRGMMALSSFLVRILGLSIPSARVADLGRRMN